MRITLTQESAAVPALNSASCDLSDRQINEVWDQCDGDLRGFVQRILDLGIQVGSGAQTLD